MGKWILSFYAAQWARLLLVAIGRCRLHRFIARVRISELPNWGFLSSIRSVRLEVNDSSAMSPFALGEWRPLLVRFNLDTERPVQEWRGPLRFLRCPLIDVPTELVEFPARDIPFVSDAFAPPGLILARSQAPRIDADRGASRSINTRFALQTGLLAQSIRGRDIDYSAFRNNTNGISPSWAWGRCLTKLGIRRIFALYRGDRLNRFIYRFLDSGETVIV